MTDVAVRRCKAGAYFLWLLVFSVGVYRLWDGFFRADAAIAHTDEMTQTMNRDSSDIQLSVQRMKSTSQDTLFLQGLVNVLPQSKTFIRTQKAMSDELNVLRYKVGQKVKNDLHILVDTRANKLYVKQGLLLLWDADCSVGRGGILTDAATGRRWEFVTPRGQFEVRDKIVGPIWRKPDWAFVEEKKPVPPPGDPSRQAVGELGAYVLNLGHGYLIHGTKNEAALGRPASHGCVRLGAENLQKLFDIVPKWTKVYIY